jgi:Plasmid recombination enzyme
MWFGSCRVLSADVHLDEPAPHMHVLLLPLCDGHMQGSAVVGGPSKLRATHAGFQADIGAKHGLAMPSLPRPPRDSTGAVESHGSLCSVGFGVGGRHPSGPLRLGWSPAHGVSVPLVLTLGPSCSTGSRPVRRSAASSDETTADERSCRDCHHRMRHGNCARPTEAGLAGSFSLQWAPDGHAVSCKAFEAAHA